MRRRAAVSCLLAVCLLAAGLPWVAVGQPAPASSRVAPPRFERLTLEDGLSQGDVNALMQDRQGYLWIATDAGLNRYDGYDFHVYRPIPFDATSLPDDYIRALYEDTDGSLLVGTTYAGLCRLDRATDAFTCDHPAPGGAAGTFREGPLSSILRTRDGTLWVGASSGLYRQDAPGRYTRFAHAPDDPTSLSHTYVTALHEDQTGTLWVSTWNGLSRLDALADDGRATFSRFLFRASETPTLADRVYAISSNENAIPSDERASDRWWIGTGRGLVAFDPTTGAHERFEPLPGDGAARNRVHRVAFDPLAPRTLWVPIVGEGLAHFDVDTGGFTRFPAQPDDPTGLVRGAGSTVFVDRFGTVWIGADGGGLNRFDPSTRNVHHLGLGTPTRPGLRNVDVWGLHVTADGLVWAGTSGRHLHRIDAPDAAGARSVRVWTASPRFAPRTTAQPAGEPNDFAETPDGALWIATTDGLSRLDRASGTFTHVVHDPADSTSLADDPVLTLLPDHSDPMRLWVGTEAGVYLLDAAARRVVQRFRHDPDDPASIADEWVAALWQQPDGTLWVGHDLGLSRLDPAAGTFTHLLHDPADPTTLTSGTVSAIHERASEPGVLWIGTLGGGLDRLDVATSAITHHTTATSELPDNTIYALLEEPSGALWMSTTRGLARLSFDPLAVRRFGPASGVQQLEFNQFAAHVDSMRGRFFFGGINGLTWFHPGAMAYNPHPPDVRLTGLRVADEPLRVSDDGPLRQPLAETTALTLPFHSRTLRIDFVGLHFKNPERNRYRYRLRGLPGEDAWSTPTTQRAVTFTNLDAGSYTFAVEAANADGVWSAAPRVLSITIRPPWWRSAWAYVLYAALLGLGVLVVDRVQRRRLLARVRERQRAKERAHAREIEAAYHELRTAKDRLVEQEKLASLGALTAGIAHEIKNPLNFITNFADVAQELADEVREAERAGEPLARLLDELGESTRVIAHHGRRADGIVKGMMQHARASSGERETVDLNRLVAEHAALAHHGRRAQTPGFDVTLVEDYDASVGTLAVQPQELGRVVVNLLTNAFDALAEHTRRVSAGGDDEAYKPRVTISTERAGDAVAIRVADNGPGIPDDLRARIFEPFFTTKPTGSGTGLGLSMSYDIVTQGHGGTLAVEDAPDGGAVFAVTLPASESVRPTPPL